MKLTVNAFSTGGLVSVAGDINYPSGMAFIDIYTSLNVLVDQFVTSVASDAYDMPTTIADGDYRLYFRVPGSLKKRVDVTYDDSIGLSGVDVELLFGDLNGDNYVSQAEVNYVYAHIGYDAPEGYWIPYDAYWLAACDFNRDGEITSADYDLCSGNVGEYGD